LAFSEYLCQVVISR